MKVKDVTWTDTEATNLNLAIWAPLPLSLGLLDILEVTYFCKMENLNKFSWPAVKTLGAKKSSLGAIARKFSEVDAQEIEIIALMIHELQGWCDS